MSTSTANKSTTTKATSNPAATERRGAVLDILCELLKDGHDEEVISLFKQLVARNTDLERRLAQMLSRGRKSEGVSSAQLKLLLDELSASGEAGGDPLPADIVAANEKLHEAFGHGDAEKERTVEPRRRQPSLRQPLPANLPRVDNEITVPASERACPICHKERKCIGHDVTEVVDLIPAQVIVRVDRREKLACDDCEGELVRAPVGDKVVEGGRLGSTLVSDLLVSKYRDGLPLHRQKDIYARRGLPLSVSTLGDQVTWATDLLKPLWRAARREVLNAKVMHLDATGLPVLDKQAAGGKRLGTLWGYVGGGVAHILYASTGKKVGQEEGELGPQDMLDLRKGYVVADASNLFDQSFKRDDLIECGCNMHARRYFCKALDDGDTRAALPIGAFKILYEIEAELREVSDEQRRAGRQAKSKPIYDELIAWCQTLKPHEPPSSLLGKAIKYLLNHRLALMRFLDDGAIPMDNGIVERLHVRTAISRKNFLFAGSDNGGQRAAIAYTILGCCQLAEVNPVEYLADVLPRLNGKIRLRDVPALLPANWKSSRPQIQN